MSFLIVFVLIVLLGLSYFLFRDWGDTNKRIKELENENRKLRGISDRLMAEIRVLRDAAELGLPYPTIEAFEREETRIKEIIEKELHGSQE